MRQADLGRIGFNVSHKLIQVLGRKVVARHDHHGATGGTPHRLEIVHRVIGKAFVHGLVGCMADVDHQQGVTIRLGTGYLGCTN